MFAAIRSFVGNLVYWIGSGVAILVVLQGIAMAVATGNVIVPLLFGVAGAGVWLIADAFKHVLSGR